MTINEQIRQAVKRLEAMPNLTVADKLTIHHGHNWIDRGGYCCYANQDFDFLQGLTLAIDKAARRAV